ASSIRGSPTHPRAHTRLQWNDPRMIIDVHCHYVFSQRLASSDIERFSFEPAGRNGQPAFDSFVSPRNTKRMSWRTFQWLLGIRPTHPPGPQLDAQIERMFQRHVLGSQTIDRFVLLAFDEYHDRDGRRPPPPTQRGQLGSDMYTSNSLVRAACLAHSARCLFGASLHPYRENATACVEEVFAAGATLIKWLPLNQNIDVTDPRTIDFLRCCARLGLPILAHYGAEFTLSTQHPQFI